MKDVFYIVLPSNSSMSYYPDNTTTRYTTHLPQSVSLHGSWGVSLAEIHIPMTLLHVPPEGEHNFINVTTNVAVPSSDAAAVDFKEDRACVPPGVYRSVASLLDAINEIPCVIAHLKFSICNNGYVAVTRICSDCKNLEHAFHFSDALNKVLGYTHTSGLVVQRDAKCTAQRPANITNAIPDQLFVYTDICEPYITGDVHTPLLRVVPYADNYNYGSMKIRSFSPPRYIPLLRTSFQAITIDIRDEFGEPIPFEYGTLTVTLQFKRID